MNTGGIDQHDLAFGTRDDSLDLEARGLRFVGNGAHQPVQERRLASIRPADKGDVAAAIVFRLFEFAQGLLALPGHFAHKARSRREEFTFARRATRRRAN